MNSNINQVSPALIHHSRRSQTRRNKPFKFLHQTPHSSPISLPGNKGWNQAFKAWFDSLPDGVGEEFWSLSEVEFYSRHPGYTDSLPDPTNFYSWKRKSPQNLPEEEIMEDLEKKVPLSVPSKKRPSNLVIPSRGKFHDHLSPTEIEEFNAQRPGQKPSNAADCSEPMLNWVRRLDKASDQRYKAFQAMTTKFHEKMVAQEDLNHDIGDRLWKLAKLFPKNTLLYKELTSLWQKSIGAAMENSIWVRKTDMLGSNASNFERLDCFEWPCICGECFACTGDIEKLDGKDRGPKPF